MKTRILLDMDGVLTDFVGGALRIHGWTREAFEHVWPLQSYDLAGPMGLTEEAFWRPISAMNEVFWMGLQPLPWARELMELIRSVTDDWYIVSRPSQDPSCYSGKAFWLKRFFQDQSFDRFVLTPHKHIFVGPNVLLIDDLEENINNFVAVGGDGLVFPSRHNCLHRFANNPMHHVSNRFPPATPNLDGDKQDAKT